MRHLWNHIEQMGRAHGVDPLVFAVLYLAHHPLFWGTMAWLAYRVRKRRPIVLQVILGTFFWLMPYLYILVFGHGLPLWIYGAVAVILIVGGRHAFLEFRKRLAAAKQSAPATDADVAITR